MKRKADYVAMLVLGLVALVAVGMAPVADATAQEAKEADTEIVIDGSTTVGPIAKAFAEYTMAMTPDVTVSVSESGSGNGAKSLINGKCHIATMSRFMKDAEFKTAVANGVTPVAHVVATDGIAAVVNPTNPVSRRGLSLRDLRDIYAGKITRWSQLGGPDMPIIMAQRDSNSGTFETFDKLVMGGDDVSGEAETYGSNGAIKQKVASTPTAIGYVGLGFIDESVRALEIDGVYPDSDTVSSGRYPIARPLFMFTDGYPRLGTRLHRFITLYLTPKGQEIIEAEDFIPLTKYPKKD